jgi:3-oxoacyl-[acyl-carrier-protein] synthase III
VKILTIRHAIPSRRITNDWVLGKLREHNAARFPPDQWALAEARVLRFLDGAGTQVRYALDDGERAIDFALDAGRRALSDAGLSPGDLDFLLYVGVCRGWTEPAMANVVQAELGLTNATCFDVVDACASWLRGLQIAHTYLRSGIYRCGMIVNCECSFVPYRDWDLASLEEIEYRAAGWTAGEAATATIVNDDNPNDDFHFVFKNFGEHYGLCMFPLAMVGDYVTGPLDERHVPMRFFASSRELFALTTKKVIETYEADPILRNGRYDIGFGHEASARIAEIIARKLGLPAEGYVRTHAQYGNTVSASVPLGMSLALQEKRLQRGHRVLVVVGASGITVGIASFAF